MAVCTFFGHRDCPEELKEQLTDAVTDLIVNHGVTMFYVGSQGRFDALARRVLREQTQKYPQTDYAVVLAYMPGEARAYEDHSDSMLPEGIETVHPRYAISWRNDWMLRHADYVVTYITHSWGGAARYAQKAQRQGKRVIALG